MLGLGLTRAVRAGRRGDEITGITLTGLTSGLLSPISWTHHLYRVIPAVVVFVDVAAGTPLDGRSPLWLRDRPAAARAGAALAAAVVGTAFIGSLVWFFDVPQPGGAVGMLGQNAYLLIMVALLAVLPVRDVAGAPCAARRPARPPPVEWSPR